MCISSFRVSHLEVSLARGTFLPLVRNAEAKSVSHFPPIDLSVCLFFSFFSLSSPFCLDVQYGLASMQEGTLLDTSFVKQTAMLAVALSN